MRRRSNHRQLAKLLVSLVSAYVSAGVANAQDPSQDRVQEPLAATFDNSYYAARHGDAKAAAKLFKESNECLTVSHIDNRMRTLLADKNSLLNRPSEHDSSSEEDKTIARMEQAAKRADASRAMCEGLEDKVTNEKIYDIALTSAKLGDAAAAACFIMAPWPVEQRDVDPTKAREYRDEAPVIEEKALNQGDWRVVRALAVSAASSGYGGYAGYIYHHDASAQLRYTKLIRLGTPSDSDEAKNLDLAIQVLTAQVSAADASEADEGAHKLYASKYSTLPPPTTQPSPCNA